MTTFLTFAVQSLNINNYLPVQSLYIPLISTYFMFSIFITFFSLIWFLIANKFVSKPFLPKPFEKIAKLIQTCLFCIYPEVKEKVKPVETKIVQQTTENKKETIESIEAPSISAVEQPDIVKPSKCDKCTMCSKCQEEKDKEKNKKKLKETIEALVNPLNLVVFFFAVIAFILLHVIIWLRNLFNF